MDSLYIALSSGFGFFAGVMVCIVISWRREDMEFERKRQQLDTLRKMDKMLNKYYYMKPRSKQ